MRPPLDDLNALRTFVAVAEAGSFTAAAERLGAAKAQVSLQVSRFEAALGERLFHRTTRRVSLTGAGQKLLDDAAPLLQALAAAVEGVRTGSELAGRLRIGATLDHTAQSLAGAVADFAVLHPRLQIELRSSDRVADMVTEGIDVSFRMGWLRDSSQRATSLGTFEQGLVASPRYLKLRGTPAHPSELADHEWLALTLLASPLTWTFQPPSGEPVTVRMRARLRTDSSAALRSLLAKGAGISVLNLQQAQDELASGTLVRVLARWKLPQGGFHAVFPPGRLRAPAAAAFVEFLRGKLA